MGKEIRLFFKVLFSVIGLLIIAYIFMVSMKMGRMKQPEGEGIRLQDVRILADALGQPDLCSGLSNESDELLTYSSFLDFLSAVDRDREDHNLAGEYKERYKEKYKSEYYVAKKDWYEVFDRLLDIYQMRSTITLTDVTVAGVGGDVSDAEGISLPEQWLLAVEGTYKYLSDQFTQYKYQVVRAYQKEGILLTVTDVVSRSFQLDNIWIMETEDEGVLVYTLQHEIFIPYKQTDQSMREQVADFYFADGSIQSVVVKKDKINGKILSIGGGIIEIEGVGKYQFQDNMKIYQLYGSLWECKQEDLRIGYDFTDFVLADGVICAGLITRDEAMENIRVNIKNSDFSGRYHERAELTADTGFTVQYGTYDALEEEKFDALEVVEIGPDSKFFKGDRIYVKPEALTGRISLQSVKRAQGTPSYRGTIEITKTESGLVLVNEVLLEEYLYSVVPSEMPASYPLEALKAQAVCARTYAYRYMRKSGLPDLGAHVDDSVGYQVYNNITENEQSTKSVKETAGQLLYNGEELCGAYYYSTSCGFGTDTGVWKSGNEPDKFLQSERIGTDTEYTGENMTDEKTFQAFIQQTDEDDYEKEESWYRWSCEVENIKEEELLDRLKKRYENNNLLVLTKKDDDFISESPDRIGKIKDIRIVKRNPGGVADELIIEGKDNTYKIISEYNIRYILNADQAKITRQDGSAAASSSLLPSAYLMINVCKEENIVVGYTIIGGGYGHGVGMSQNAAKQMAQRGMNAQDILTFFYRFGEIKAAY